MLNGFLNVQYTKGDIATVFFRTYKSNVWTKYIDTHVSFSTNDWKSGYTSFGIPTVVSYIPSDTVITLGLGDSYLAAVGISTEFTVTRINS